MSRQCRWAVAITILAVGMARGADPAPGFGASVRVGYGNAMGSIAAGQGSMGATFGGELPVQVDVGYRFTPELALAIYGQYGFASASSDLRCVQLGLSCSGRDVRVGFEAFWHFLPGHALDPWVGGGLGYEWATITMEGRNGTGQLTLGGAEYANAQLGADYALNPSFSAGPFVQLTLATYSTLTSTLGSASASAALDGTLHEWFQLGIRGSFRL